MSDSASPSAPTVELARHLGLFEATMIGVGAMIGAGIFVLTGLAAGEAGPAALLAFALNGVVTLFTALSYAELSSEIPEAGGGYSFVRKVMPDPVAFISGWMLWFAYVIACSLYAKGFGSYFLEFFSRYVPGVTDALLGTLGHHASVALLTVLIGVLFLAVNVVGAHASGQTENVITVGKILILAVFVGFGLLAVGREPAAAAANFTPMFPNGAGGVLAAMGLTFIAFEGYDLIATVSEEVKDPRRNIPRAILYSLSITMVVYLLVVFVSLGAVPPAEGLPTWQLLDRYGEIGIVRAAQAFMPRFGVVLVLAGGLLATLSALNATILASSRVAYSMGRDWMLPNRLSRLHPVRRTPVLAISATGVLFLGLAVFLPLETIGMASSLLFLLTFGLVNAALLVYRRRNPEPPLGFRVPLFPLTPILGILTCAGLGAFQLWHQRMAGVIAVAWVAVGLVIYGLAFGRRAAIAYVPRVLESPTLRTLRGRKTYRVLVPVSNPDRVVPLMELAASVAASIKGEVVGLAVVEVPEVTAYADASSFTEAPRRLLEQAESIALRLGVPCSSLLRIGRSARNEIVATAREHGCDLILLGYKKDEDPLENSLIHHVIAEQPCDVAILKTRGRSIADIGRILLPIAGREVHDRLKVRLVHGVVRGLSRRGTAAPEVAFLSVVPGGAAAIEQKRARQVLDRAAGTYGFRDATRLVVAAEDPGEAIETEVREGDLLVLGLRAEPALRRFFFGSLAQRVAGKVSCPVLLTKARPPRRKRIFGRR